MNQSIFVRSRLLNISPPKVFLQVNHKLFRPLHGLVQSGPRVVLLPPLLSHPLWQQLLTTVQVVHGYSRIISAPIGAWKSNFPHFYDFITDRPTDGRTYRPGQREVTLPMNVCTYVCCCVCADEIHLRNPRRISQEVWSAWVEVMGGGGTGGKVFYTYAFWLTTPFVEIPRERYMLRSWL